MMRFTPRDYAAAFLCLLATVYASFNAVALLELHGENGRIAALSAGRDVTLPQHASPEERVARGVFLLAHDRVDDAQVEFDRIADRPDTSARDVLLYGLANAHLKRALETFSSAPMRKVAPLIALAQSEYRQVLRHDPQNWDARYNFDIASALTHDAEVAAYLKGDDMARERALVPDAPGAPNGLP
jgi:mxaK protein